MIVADTYVRLLLLTFVSGISLQYVIMEQNGQ